MYWGTLVSNSSWLTTPAYCQMETAEKLNTSVCADSTDLLHKISKLIINFKRSTE